MIRLYFAALGSVLLSGPAALADCKNDIQAMMKAGETASNYREETQTLIGGQVVQHSTQFYQDYSHFYQVVKETGVHWLVLGNQEYVSRDGMTWSPSRTRAPDWLEDRLAANAATRETIKDIACETEDLDGVTLRKFTYIQETTDPPAVSTVITWLPVDSDLPIKRSVTTEMSGQVIEMNVTFDRNDEVVLPKP
ncbi:hypothetical protein [Roseibium sp.]|uniref:hypothetical protein n=1 Tax=Roseibium sp. TaxID=1936156 RepID=UPI003A970AE0